MQEIREPWRGLIKEAIAQRESHAIAIEQLEGKTMPHRREIDAINKHIHALVRGIVAEAGLPATAIYSISSDGSSVTGEIEVDPTPAPEGSV